MMGRFASLTWIILLVGCAAVGAASPPILPPAAGVVAVDVVTTALPLSANDPQVSSIGALTYRGGVAMKSTNPNFGGISGLRLLPDGRLLGVTDRGYWALLRPKEKNNILIGVSDVVMAPLLDSDGAPLPADDRDSESVEITLRPTPQNAAKDVALLPGADVHISFERNHRVWRYEWPQFTPLETLFSSKAKTASDEAVGGWLRTMPNNGGPEAQAATEAAHIIISEDRLHANSGHDARITRLCFQCRALIWRTQIFGFSTEAGFKPTDAHWLPSAQPSSKLLVLYRAFSPLSGVRAKLKLYDLTDVKSGQLLEGETLMTLAPPYSVDNMEGLAVEARDDKYMIYLVSDDNFNGLQRNLLMKFEWKPKVPQR